MAQPIGGGRTLAVRIASPSTKLRTFGRHFPTHVDASTH